MHKLHKRLHAWQDIDACSEAIPVTGRGPRALPPPLVITHPELGIYLGEFPGGHVWSRLDPMGRTLAVTFDDLEQARCYVKEQLWSKDLVDALGCQPVDADMGRYASMQACVHAGLPGWLDSLTPTLNERMC